MEEWEVSEEDVVTVSGLEHYSYCPRQWALIYREQTFDENVYTLRGRASHERVDEAIGTVERGIRVERGLPIWSMRLGLVGKADLVEFHGDTPFPVEYKYGPQSAGGHADLQLCAQAICLEEMTGRRVPKGAVYQVSARRRREVSFTRVLRERVESTVEGLRRLQREPVMPRPVADARCNKCSLKDSCMPQAVTPARRVKVLHRQLFELKGES